MAGKDKHPTQVSVNLNLEADTLAGLLGAKRSSGGIGALVRTVLYAVLAVWVYYGVVVPQVFGGKDLIGPAAERVWDGVVMRRTGADGFDVEVRK